MTNISGTATVSMSGLKSHDVFFSRIIGMIPAELYKHSLSEDGEGAVNTKYYKHRKLPLTADEKKTLSKQKIAEKYAPVKRQQNDSDSDGNTSSDDEPEDDVENGSVEEKLPTFTSESCNDINILRQRLQERISGLKVDRTSKKEHKIKAHEEAAAKKATKAPEKAKKNTQKKRKHSDSSSAEGNEIVTKIQKVASAAIEPANALEAATDNGLEFNKMMMIHEDSVPAGTDKNKGKPGSKVQRLKRLLDEAHQKREKITQMKNSSDPEEQQALRNVKWSDAIKSASGDKSVLLAGSSASGNSGLSAEAKLKKALKRKEKAKQKSAAEWKARLDAVEESKAAKITKREENITERKNAKHGILSEADKEKLAKSVKNGNHKANGDGKEGSGGKDTRVGFEGKKTTGEFLNKKNAK